jgi:phosphatidyl-myo-inositol alpha-mannosyltransferase
VTSYALTPAVSPLRIGIVCASWPVPGRKPGGVDVSAKRLAEALTDRGHTVRVFSFSSLLGTERYDRVQLRPVGIHNRKFVGRFLLIPLLLNRLSTEGLDVLHIHGDDWLFVRRRVPTVRTFHGSALLEALHATNPLRRASQLVFFGTELVSARLATASYTINAGDISLYSAAGSLNHGIDITAEATAQCRSTTPSILFVGTWEGRKRGQFLARVFEREIRPRVTGAQLWMVSDRCEPAADIRWFRRPSEGQLAELYRRAWVFCLPSTYEAFGIPYLEAMTGGAAVVASPNPGAMHLLDDGSAGLVVDDADLGTGLSRLLTDGGLRNSLVAAGIERARHFSWEKVLCSYEQAYTKAIETWRTQRSWRERGSR